MNPSAKAKPSFNSVSHYDPNGPKKEVLNFINDKIQDNISFIVLDKYLEKDGPSFLADLANENLRTLRVFNNWSASKNA